ncbi:uncharacterized protein RAG0_11835 [Rhynchosporium agropyri]|uniref:Uncharacterized protein n=1 Tax=Rhynchosporium agropyri TaxID=914238 RepID=A0A1E1L6A0_9HELO|nr:uncharacterized protein RAG0_11835 [Rhynchosporium agropyri]
MVRHHEVKSLLVWSDAQLKTWWIEHHESYHDWFNPRMIESIMERLRADPSIPADDPRLQGVMGDAIYPARVQPSGHNHPPLREIPGAQHVVVAQAPAPAPAVGQGSQPQRGIPAEILQLQRRIIELNARSLAQGVELDSARAAIAGVTEQNQRLTEDLEEARAARDIAARELAKVDINLENSQQLVHDITTQVTGR